MSSVHAESEMPDTLYWKSPAGRGTFCEMVTIAFGKNSLQNDRSKVTQLRRKRKIRKQSHATPKILAMEESQQQSEQGILLDKIDKGLGRISYLLTCDTGGTSVLEREEEQERSTSQCGHVSSTNGYATNCVGQEHRCNPTMRNTSLIVQLLLEPSYLFLYADPCYISLACCSFSHSDLYPFPLPSL